MIAISAFTGTTQCITIEWEMELLEWEGGGAMGDEQRSKYWYEGLFKITHIPKPGTVIDINQAVPVFKFKTRSMDGYGYGRGKITPHITQLHLHFFKCEQPSADPVFYQAFIEKLSAHTEQLLKKVSGPYVAIGIEL